MKKKNLLILLIIPFLVSTLTIITVNVTYNLVDVDIAYIEWVNGYDDVEALQREDKLELLAIGVNNNGADAGKNDELRWSVKNVDGTETVHASISEDGRYLVPDSSGSFNVDGEKEYDLDDAELLVTCSNKKGNVTRSFKVIVYAKGAITINSKIPSSTHGKIDYIEYFGEYDVINGKKTEGSFNFTVKLVPESLKDANPTISISGDASIDFDFSNGKVSGGGYVTEGVCKLKKPSGDGKSSTANFTVGVSVDGIKAGSYNFSVVKDGVNVYSYDDLLYCTNKSQEGEIAVLHKSFVSYKQNYGESEVCFGHDKGNGTFTFSETDGSLYRFDTKYNHEYLDQWNEANPNNRVEPKINAGLRVKKDFYGNGYQINFHNLAFPTGTNATSGTPEPTAKDLFKGPLSFYTVGNPASSAEGGMSLNLVTAYGQDNVGLYIDGDNITINDLKVQNCDDQESLSFYEYVGTVVDVDGDNVTILNCRMSNGKNVLRSFSNQNLTVKNCMLSNSQNFLFMTGANEYEKPSRTKNNSFTTASGTVNGTLDSFLIANGVADSILDDYLGGRIGGSYAYTKEQLKTVLNEIQNALTVDLSGRYKGSTELCDCLFFQSGIASVAFESLFNGSFLYSSELPHTIATYLNMLNQLLGDFSPTNIGGTSYPVSVNVSGNTKFYDYKTLDTLDISGLVGESISVMLNSDLVGGILGDREFSITIDDIFPIKSILKNMSVSYDNEGKKYVNIPFAFYGGGANYSTLTFKGYEEKSHVNGTINEVSGAIDERAIRKVDLLDNYLGLPVTNNSYGVNGNTLIKTVTLVTGYEPFKFVFNKGDGYLYGEKPQIEEMQKRAAIYGTTEA